MSTESFSPAPTAAEPSSNERLLAALCYPLFPIVSLFILFIEEHKNKAFERYHAIQAIPVGILVWVISGILGATVIGCILAWIPWVVSLYLAYLAYQGKMFEVPVVTQFMRDQKWL